VNTTGWQVVDTMLGGGFIKEHFFKRVRGREGDLDFIADAWMQTALSAYRQAPYLGRARAVGWDGQEWKIEGGRIAKGTKH
jgi:hypothetical protein